MRKEKISKLDCVVIYGPTASGKSAYALRLAEKMNGVVINADVMQLYPAFPVLSAQPTAADTATIEHRLYSILANDQWCDAYRWRNLAIAEIERAHQNGKMPVIAGGTGFYLLSLLQGIAAMPKVSNEMRNFIAIRLSVEGHVALHQELQTIDPSSAAKIKANDTQRLIRALEVYHATGTPLSEWQQKSNGMPAPYHFSLHVLLPDRAALYDKINSRVLQMIDHGVIGEIKNNMNCQPEWPIYKTHGFREFKAYLDGETSLDDAINKTQQITRNYAKRQMTWARHQMTADKLNCDVQIV